MNIIRKEDFGHICRFCLSVTKLNNIFQDNTLLTIIQEVSLIQMSPNDALPKSLCHSCVEQVIQFYIFKKKALESETKLKQILADTDLIKNNTFIREIEFEDCETVINTVDIPDVDNSENFLVTVKGVSDSDSETSTSGTDEEYFDVTSDSEVETLRKTYNIPKKMEIIFTDTETFQDQQYDNYIEISTPKETPEPKIINCICGLNFSDQSEYVEHRKDPKHVKVRPASCEICGRTFCNKWRVKIHMRTHTKEKPYECQLCFTKFTQRGNYQRHLLIHTGAKPYVCEICGLSFNQSTALKGHLKTHSSDKPFICQYCGVAFSTKPVLNNHIGRIHYNIKTNGSSTCLCSSCGKIFKSWLTLREHSANVHSDERIFKCDSCTKSFRTKSGLYQHTLIHKGLKKYVCQFCGKRFTQGSHLYYHLKIHNEEKRFQCRFCDKRFTLKQNWTVHERTHTGERPYICEVCSKGFYASNALKKHRRVHLG